MPLPPHVPWWVLQVHYGAEQDIRQAVETLRATDGRIQPGVRDTYVNVVRQKVAVADPDNKNATPHTWVEQAKPPGMVFVQMQDSAQLRDTLSTRLRLMGHVVTRIDELPPHLIERYLPLELQPVTEQAIQTLTAGATVTITEGTYAGFPGTIESVEGTMVTVIVSMFGRAVPVKVPVAALESA